jgi:hypothetical protein
MMMRRTMWPSAPTSGGLFTPTKGARSCYRWRCERQGKAGIRASLSHRTGPPLACAPRQLAADLPVDRATKIELTLNLKAAKAVGGA